MPARFSEHTGFIGYDDEFKAEEVADPAQAAKGLSGRYGRHGRGRQKRRGKERLIENLARLASPLL
jgi:hypothetical protein